MIANIDEPRTTREVMGMSDVDSWMKAIDEEMVTLKKNKTWDPIHFLVGCKFLLVVNGYSRKSVVLMTVFRSIRDGWSLKGFHRWRELIMVRYSLLL